MAMKIRLGSYISDLAVLDRSFADSENPLLECQIIAIVNQIEMLPDALLSLAKVIYLAAGDPLTLPAAIETVCRHGKLCLINIDTIDGLARDRHALEFLVAHNAAGVVSTRSEMLKIARSMGLITILRTFAIDELAITSLMRSLRDFCPDAVEVMPAIAAPKIVRELRPRYPNLHVIGGGLLSTAFEIEKILQSEVNSVSSVDRRLWVA